jgi:hypothetical protein
MKIQAATAMLGVDVTENTLMTTSTQSSAEYSRNMVEEGIRE